MRIKVAAAACALVIAAGSSAASATHGGDTAEPRLLVVEQTTWVGPEGDWVLRVDPGDTSAESLDVTLHDRVVGRDQFTEGLDGQTLNPTLSQRCGVILASGPAILDVCRIPLDQAARDADGAITIVLGLRSSSAGSADRLLVADEGVYPVSVGLVDADGATQTQITTHLVRLPIDDDSPPLAAGLVVPVAAPVALQPDGSVHLASSLADLQNLVTTLADEPTVPLTILPSPETIEALARTDEAVAADLSSAITGRQVLGQPYVELDVTSWWNAALDDELSSQLTAGSDRTAELLGTRPDRRTWPMASTVSPETLDRLRVLGVDRVVIAEERFEPPDETLFPTALDRPFQITTADGAAVPALMDDAALRAHAGSTGDPRLDAHHLLADLAVLYFQWPGTPRGVAVSFTPDQVAEPTFLSTVLAGLAEPGVVRGATLDDIFASATPAQAGGVEVSDGDPLVRSYTTEPPPDLGDYPERLAATRAEQSTIDALFPQTDAGKSDADELVLVGGAQGLSATEQQAYLDASVADLDDVVAGIAAPEQAPVTLTAREGQVPVVLRNDLDQPVEVLVTLRSAKLEFPEGSQMRTTLPPGESRLEFAVRTRASGAFPVDIEVSSPDGALDLAATRFTLRSTVVPGIGIALSVLAALFLLVWWTRHWRSTRRAEHLVRVGRDGSGTTDEAERSRQQAIDQVTQV